MGIRGIDRLPRPLLESMCVQQRGQGACERTTKPFMVYLPRESPIPENTRKQASSMPAGSKTNSLRVHVLEADVSSLQRDLGWIHAGLVCQHDHGETLIGEAHHLRQVPHPGSAVGDGA